MGRTEKDEHTIGTVGIPVVVSIGETSRQAAAMEALVVPALAVLAEPAARSEEGSRQRASENVVAIVLGQAGASWGNSDHGLGSMHVGAWGLYTAWQFPPLFSTNCHFVPSLSSGCGTE